MRPRPVHPTPLAWARHAAGEGHGLSGWRFRRHLAGCAACRRLEAELVRERAEFEASPRRGEDLRLLQAAASRPGGAPIPRRATAPRLRPLAAAMPAVALLAVVTALALRDERSSLREKGGSALMLFVDRPAGPEPLGERCAPGDRLIARYRTDLRYLLLLQRDGPGAVQVLFPQDGAASGKLPAGEGTTPTSFILDDAPGPECFAALFSDAPLAARPVLDLFARSAAPAAVPGAVVRVSCCAKGATR